VLSGIQRFREDFEKQFKPGEATGVEESQAEAASLAEQYH
jgi:hypothetical protein